MPNSIDASRLSIASQRWSRPPEGGCRRGRCGRGPGPLDSVSVRLGKVEATEASESDDISLRVFVGRRVASVSATAASDPKTLAERAVAMAKVSPEDPYPGPCRPGAAGAARSRPRPVRPDRSLGRRSCSEDALAAEEAALAVTGVTNSGGAAPAPAWAAWCWPPRTAFVGQYVGTRFGRSVSVIAGEGTAMERDYDYSSRLHFADLDAPDDDRPQGRRARGAPAQSAQGRDRPGRRSIYDPRVARGIAGHLAGAINGASVARKTSFLRDMMGKQVACGAITVTDDPLHRARPRLAPVRRRGRRGRKAARWSRTACCKHWFLSTSAARELGLETNGRGARGGTSVSPSSTNLAHRAGRQRRRKS